MSEIITLWFQSIENQTFLSVILLSLNNFDISTLDYIRDSAHMQWQNSILATPISVANWCNVLVGIGFFRGIAGLYPDIHMDFPYFVLLRDVY